MIETYLLKRGGDKFLVVIKDAPTEYAAAQKAEELVEAYRPTEEEEDALDIIDLAYQFPVH